VLPFGRLSYETPDNAIGYAMHSSRSHDAVIRVYDDAGNVIQTHERKSSVYARIARVTCSGPTDGTITPHPFLVEIRTDINIL